MAAEKKTPTRIYVVTHKVTGSIRLIRATQPGPARNHVAKSLLDVRVASQDDLVKCVGDKITVEVAGEDAPE